LIIVILLLVY